MVGADKCPRADKTDFYFFFLHIIILPDVLFGYLPVRFGKYPVIFLFWNWVFIF